MNKETVEARFEFFLEEAMKLAYNGREFQGKTYADKIEFLREIQREVSKHKDNSNSVYEVCIYECLFALIGEEIWQTKKEALSLPVKNNKYQ